jgi:hypothetical protein
MKWSVLTAVVLLAACRGPIRGEFGFSPVDRRDSGVLERAVVLETEFRLGRENLFFHDNETIFWIYRMEAGPYSQGNFLVSLNETGRTPQPVEIDLRHVDVEKQHGVGVIRQRYEPLKPGDYIIRIAQHSTVVDEAAFRVLPSEEEPEVTDDSTDEIITYSRRTDG